jgi:hypothetical protein
MEIPFDIESNLETIGNITICRKNADPMFQRREHNVFLSNRQVGEKLGTTPGVSELYKHQLLASRYLFHQDSLLLLHEPGTGKTETSQFAMMLLLASGIIDKIMIVNSSGTLNVKAKRTFKNIWDIDRFNNRFAHLTIEEFVDQHVIFDTYTKLPRILTASDTNPFDHVGVIFDEAHNLVSESGGVKKKTTVDLIAILARSKGCKVMLSTATPIINEATSFDIIRRVLLRIPFTDSLEPEMPPTNANLSAFGIPGELVSYKRAVYDHLQVKQVWNPNDPFQGRVVALDPNEPAEECFPLRVYRLRPQRCQLRDIVEYLVSIDKETFLVHFDAFMIASESDKIDIGQYKLTNSIPTVEEQDDIDSQTGGMPLVPSVSDLGEPDSKSASGTATEQQSTTPSYTGERVVVDSCIMEEIVKNIRASKDGVVLIYMSLKVNGSEVVGRLLEKYGFEAYTGQRKEKPTYLLYESGSSEKQRRLFDDAKKPENWNGSIVKVIIGSRVMRDSVDIHHVVQIHIAQPEWHIPGLIQAWHRGIRSNGHNWLIYHRALELVKASEGKLSLEDARKQVVIDYQVFNYVIDIEDLTDTEINTCRNMFRMESNKSLSNEEIRKRVNERNPSLKKVEKALEKYRDVGTLMDSLRKNSLDYHLNGGDHVVRPEVEQPIQASENLFFTSDIYSIVMRVIQDMITSSFHLQVSELVEVIRGRYSFLTENTIISSLVYMWKNKYLLFVPKFGIRMKLVIAKGIVFLVSDITATSFGATTYSDDTNTCIQSELSFSTPPIHDTDLTIPRTRTVNMINKLKRALGQALETTVPLGVQQEDTDEKLVYSFLKYMTNFWGFPVENLGLMPSGRELSTYIFSKHVSKCSIHIKQRLKGVIVRGKALDEWNQAKSSSSIQIVRPIELVEKYEAFDFASVPEIAPIIDMSNYVPRTNGLIMFKCQAKVPSNTNGPFRGTFEQFIDIYLTSLVDFTTVSNDQVSIRKFADIRSKGRQLEKNTTSIKQTLIGHLSQGVYIIFFPYESPVSEPNPETDNLPLLSKLLWLKNKELDERTQAELGEPIWKHHILVVEYLHASGRITLERKTELYSSIWSSSEG